MNSDEVQKYEGVWTGSEQITDGGEPYQASARLVFQAVFDSRFMVCDYIQTAPDRPTSVAHGVFRNDNLTKKLTVTWFRSPAATVTQQNDAVSDGDAMVFIETIGSRTTRTTYSATRDRLSIRTEYAVGNDEWQPLLEGSYRRR